MTCDSCQSKEELIECGKCHNASRCCFCQKCYVCEAKAWEISDASEIPELERFKKYGP